MPWEGFAAALTWLINDSIDLRKHSTRPSLVGNSVRPSSTLTVCPLANVLRRRSTTSHNGIVHRNQNETALHAHQRLIGKIHDTSIRKDVGHLDVSALLRGSGCLARPGRGWTWQEAVGPRLCSQLQALTALSLCPELTGAAGLSGKGPNDEARQPGPRGQGVLRRPNSPTWASEVEGDALCG